MDSIAIEWKKQTPGEVEISTKKKQSRNHSTWKVAPIKQIQISQITESQLTGTVRSNKLLLEDQNYTSLPTISPIPKSANDIQLYHDRRLCSVRSGIATFIIIILLILVVGIAIGIVFGVMNSQNSSGTENNNQNTFSLSTISSGVLTSSVSIGSQTGSPCLGYTQIDDPTRSISNVGTFSSCDNGYIFNTSNGGAWIRFVGAGGTTIPLSSPGVNHCGGYLAGWYNDTLPTTPNIIANGAVCFDTGAGSCAFAVDISVVFCSTYYVFFLPPLIVCNSRYCTT